MSDTDFPLSFGSDFGPVDSASSSVFDSGASPFDSFGAAFGAPPDSSPTVAATQPGNFGGNTVAQQDTQAATVQNVQQSNSDNQQAQTDAAVAASANTGGQPNIPLSTSAATAFMNHVSGANIAKPSFAPVPDATTTPQTVASLPNMAPNAMSQMVARPITPNAPAPNMAATTPGTPLPSPADSFTSAPAAPQVAPTPAPPVTAAMVGQALTQNGIKLPWYVPANATDTMANYINSNPTMSGADFVKTAQGYGLSLPPDQATALAAHLDQVRAPVPVPPARQASGPFPAVVQGTTQATMPQQPLSPQVQTAVAQEQPAQAPSQGQYPGRYGVPANVALNSPQAWDAYANRTIQLESNFNPQAQSGSYQGLGQYSAKEAAARGIDPANYGQVKAALIADGQRRVQILQRDGLPVTPGNVYLMHQQGEAGLKAHLSNPDAPAWQNEARAGRASAAWGKRAIWGNMTPAMRAKFPGGVDTVTSRQFVALWNQRFSGQPGGIDTGHPGTAYASAAPAAAARTVVASAQPPSSIAAAPQTFGQKLARLFNTKAPAAAPAPPQPNYLAAMRPFQIAQTPSVARRYFVDQSGRIATTDQPMT